VAKLLQNYCIHNVMKYCNEMILDAAYLLSPENN